MDIMERKYGNAFSSCRPAHERCDDFSLRHPCMDLGKRAKIFSPFAALRGFEEAVDSKRKLYVEKRELSEEEQEALNRTLTLLCELTANRCLAKEHAVHASVRFYVPCADENHEAYGCRGTYETAAGVVRKVDPTLRKTLLIGEREIELADIERITIMEEQ